MAFADLEKKDRRVVIAAGAVATALLVGLVITGAWHFVVFRPTSTDIVLSNGQPVLAGRPDTVTEIHGVLGDLSAILALWLAAWVSYRIFARVSRAALLCLIIVSATVYAGGFIVTNVIVEVDESATNIEQRFAIDRVPNAISMGLHIASIPAIVFLVYFAGWLSRRRRAATPAPDPSWLDQLG